MGTGSQAVANRLIVNRLIAMHGLSSFCLGMVFPYTGIYIADRPGIGPRGVALYYALSGIANLAVCLVLATGMMRPRRYRLAMSGNLISVAGYLTLALASSPPAVALAGAANGLGHGSFLAAIIPIMSSLVGESDRRVLFARRYQVLNATLAGGSLIAGGVVSAFSRDAIRALLVVSALGYVPLAATLILSRRLINDDKPDEPDRRSEAIPPRALVKAAAAVAGFQLGAYLLGYSQFEATMPLAADTLMGVGLGWISVMIAVNVAVIVLAQRGVTRLLEPYSEAFGLRVAVLVWVGGYLVAALLSAGSAPWNVAGLLLFGCAFGLGECAYSCSYHPWLISRVPAAELTRATALTNSTMAAGLFLGPSLGVLLLGVGSAAALFVALAAMCGAVALATVQWRLPVRTTGAATVDA